MLEARVAVIEVYPVHLDEFLPAEHVWLLGIVVAAEDISAGQVLQALPHLARYAVHRHADRAQIVHDVEVRPHLRGAERVVIRHASIRHRPSPHFARRADRPLYDSIKNLTH